MAWSESNTLKRLELVVPPDLMAAVERAAEKAGEKPSVFALRAIARAAKHKYQPAKRGPKPKPVA